MNGVYYWQRRNPDRFEFVIYLETLRTMNPTTEETNRDLHRLAYAQQLILEKKESITKEGQRGKH